MGNALVSKYDLVLLLLLCIVWIYLLYCDCCGIAHCMFDGHGLMLQVAPCETAATVAAAARVRSCMPCVLPAAAAELISKSFAAIATAMY